MQHLEVSGAVRPICGSLGVKRLIYFKFDLEKGILLRTVPKTHGVTEG